MKQLTPEAIGVAARLSAAREKRFGPHRGIFGSVAMGKVRVAPPDVEDFERGIRVRLAARTKRAAEGGRFRDELGHLTVPRWLDRR